MKGEFTKLQSVKADLLLINEITKPSNISQLQAPSNMSQLHNLLKFKNNKASRSRVQKQDARNWLNREGIDISPLVQRIVKAKQVIVQKEELKKIQQDCFFYIPNMSNKKIDQYLSKAFDYGTMNIIQKTMKKSNLSKIIMKRTNQKFAQNTGLDKGKIKQKHLSVISTIKTQTRDDQKREKYLQCITDLGRRVTQRQQLVSQLAHTLPHKKFWQIFHSHTKSLLQSRNLPSQQQLTYLYLDSLKQIQQQYDSYLTGGNENINYYLISNYLEKLDKRQQPYIKDREHYSFWGKAFVLYRAGRKKDFYYLLHSRGENEFFHDFNIVDHSISNKSPVKMDTKLSPTSNPSDIFRDQLIYTLKSQALYASDVISQINTLDCVWILIRNLEIAIFQGNERESFNTYKRSLIENYSKQGCQSEQILHNYLYLLAYGEIAELGLNTIMDQDDYIHFLICLNFTLHLPQLNRQKLRPLLTRQLILYIKQLINLGKSQYIYYLGLIPHEDRLVEISNLLSSTHLISGFNWQYLRNSIPSKEQFQRIVKITLEKYMNTTNNFVTGAQMYIDVLNNDQLAVRCLIQYLIKSFCINSFTDHAVLDAESALNRYLYRNSKLQSQFRLIFNFLVECRQLQQLLKDRKDQSIYNLVQQTEYILINFDISNKLKQLLNDLINLTPLGLEVYFKYLRKVIKGIETYCLRQNKHSQLVEFTTLIGESFEQLFTMNEYKVYEEKQQAKALRKVIAEITTHFDINDQQY